MGKEKLIIIAKTIWRMCNNVMSYGNRGRSGQEDHRETSGQPELV